MRILNIAAFSSYCVLVLYIASALKEIRCGDKFPLSAIPPFLLKRTS
jgi:hypothetical protein